ncbi:MAG: T9SS type A sorting domain-containing protein [Saprospiraceae bacterium]
MINKQSLILSALLLFCVIPTFAQVQFKLTFDSKKDAYVVSVIPEVTYESPGNITGTGQISFKVPTGNFDVIDLENLHPDLRWEANSRNNSPVEDSNWDYISFGLITNGAPRIDYKSGVEIPLVSFRNEQGCTGEIMLVNNDTDEFMPPNSQQANIGNQLTIFAARGNAYSKNVGNGAADCGTYAVTNTKEVIQAAQVEVYPNPATNRLNVKFNWQLNRAETTLNVLDAQGKVVMAKQFALQKGFNTLDLNVDLLPQGAYMLELRGGDLNLPLDRFMKRD